MQPKTEINGIGFFPIEQSLASTQHPYKQDSQSRVYQNAPICRGVDQRCYRVLLGVKAGPVGCGALETGNTLSPGWVSTVLAHSKAEEPRRQESRGQGDPSAQRPPAARCIESETIPSLGGSVGNCRRMFYI